MIRHAPPRWGFILAASFVLSLALAGYFALQLRRSASPIPAGFLAAEKGYGVTVDLTQLDEPALTETLNILQENGLTWLRQPILWAELELAPGQFNWQPLDQLVEQIGNSPDKFELIVVLQTTPAWARPAGTPAMTPPIEVSDFGNFARAFAARYGEHIDYYQVWHEPNLSANWGNAFVDPSAYADLLREASLTIHAVDPEAFILTAALAPTLENGPLNLNEVAYLDQLYAAKAERWFDVVAGQPYGFDSEPADPSQAETLNFRRLELLRRVMLNHGDGDTPIWATAFGWNALPADWTGPPSPWKSDTPARQAQRTADAIAYARSDWPWLGPMLAVRWEAAGLAATDPVRGFALLETPPVLAAFQAVAADLTVATPGRYPADHSSGRYSPGWRFAPPQADVPRTAPRTLTLPFEGTRLDLIVQRGPYRGYLWVTIDGQPANALPQDEMGRSYVVLYDPLRGSDSVTLAQHLPPGRHEAIIEAEGGWGQWALGGWTIYQEDNVRLAQTGLILAGLLAVLTGLGLLGWLVRTPVETGRLAWAWGEILVAGYALLHERGQIVLTFGLALGFYLAPGWFALLLLPWLALTILIRPDLGLALVALSLSFFQAAKRLPFGNFSPVELALALTVAGFIFRTLLTIGRTLYAPKVANPTTQPSPPRPDIPNFLSQIPNLYPKIQNPKSADWAALTLVALAYLATLAAGNFGVSMREWRVVVLESVIFYFLVRLGLDFSPARPALSPARVTVNDNSWGWAWRLVDAFVAGAVLQALIALYLYFLTDQSITAEGVHRALGLAYGSPNNLSLFLDRAWPILLAVAALPSLTPMAAGKIRRWLYGAGLLPVSLALYLTFSKGALLLGLPAGVIGMALLYIQPSHRQYWRRVLAAAAGGLVLMVIALIPLSQTARFRTAFDFNPGSTGFFRLKLWQASLAMLRDHPWLGVGLDNFLYQYRTRYILPAAWQEPNLSHPHNLILDFGTRLGLGGIALLLWLQSAFWLNAWRLYRRRPEPLILGLMGSMIIFLSHGLVDNAYFLVDLAFAFFLIVGIVQRLAEQP